MEDKEYQLTIEQAKIKFEESFDIEDLILPSNQNMEDITIKETPIFDKIQNSLEVVLGMDFSITGHGTPMILI